jgi:hypothetical protein
VRERDVEVEAAMKLQRAPGEGLGKFLNGDVLSMVCDSVGTVNSLTADTDVSAVAPQEHR